MDLSALARARELAGYTQDDVAAALGVARPMVSYWENGTRSPNDRQRYALKRLYGPAGDELVGGHVEQQEPDVAEMLYRKVPGVDPSLDTKHGLRNFVEFLELYAELIQAAGVEHRPMSESPFLLASGFESNDDARRKAEEVRAHLRLGLGPIVDVDDLCELLGITVFRAALGKDLAASSISGAFYRHATIGFAIVVNLEMTPGRRRFTLAHELGHALLHSHNERAVVSGPRKDARERFADTFAGEFLMPSEGIRRAMEEMGAGRRLTDPADAIHLQRFFNVSWVTALVRLKQTKSITASDFENWRDIRPVVFARSLGYEVADEEVRQDPEAWGLQRFPRSFRRTLRLALRREVLSSYTAADRTGVAVEEIEQLAIDDIKTEDSEQHRELDEFSQIH